MPIASRVCAAVRGLGLSPRDQVEIAHADIWDGTRSVYTNLLAGNVDLTIDVSSSVSTYLTSGALRSLGATTAKRTSFDPDMPTVAETVPGFEAFS